jgi:ubiquitin-activating enzyme E1
MTGKYNPLRQWLHHEFFEVLPEGDVKRSHVNSRYSDYNTLFGDDFVKTAS